MKKLLFIALSVILLSALFISGCAEPEEHRRLLRHHRRNQHQHQHQHRHLNRLRVGRNMAAP